MKIKIPPQKIHENRSDNKIKIKKVDKIQDVAVIGIGDQRLGENKSR